VAFLHDQSRLVHPDFSFPGKKPLSKVVIDRSNPLTKGLWLVQLFNDYNEPITNIPGAFQSGADIEVGYSDKILKMNGSTTGPTWTGRNAPQNLTVLGEAYYTSGTVDHALFDINDQQLVIWADTFSSQLRTSVFAGSARVGATGGLALNQWVKWGASVNGVSNTARIYIDGELETSGGMGTNTWESHDEIAIGSNYTAAGKYTNGGYKWVYVWDRILTDEEIRSINKDPYQIFKPAIPLHYFVPAAGGGGLSIPIAAYHYNHNLKR
jgi:hypothetical protein